MLMPRVNGEWLSRLHKVKEESSTDLSKSHTDGTLPLDKKHEIQTEDMDRVTTADKKNTPIEKLRKVLDSIHKYAVCSNTNPDKKECYLQYLTLCEERASETKLNAVCQKFIMYQIATSVFELCIYWAERIDPNNAASRYYKKR